MGILSGIFSSLRAGAVTLRPCSPVRSDEHPIPQPRKDHRGVDLISDALPFGRLWYGEPFGLSKEWIQEELGPLLDHYSLAR